jgi:hypothetical protein
MQSVLLHADAIRAAVPAAVAILSQPSFNHAAAAAAQQPAAARPSKCRPPCHEQLPPRAVSSHMKGSDRQRLRRG